jgi:hypothetical protein
VWLGLLDHMEKRRLRLSTLGLVVIGGAACPRCTALRRERPLAVPHLDLSGGPFVAASALCITGLVRALQGATGATFPVPPPDCPRRRFPFHAGTSSSIWR